MSEYALALAPLIGRRRIRDRSDEELLEAIGAGDEAALAALYDRFGRVAYGVALRVPRGLALGRVVPPRAGEALDLASDARPPARGRSRAPGGPTPRRAAGRAARRRRSRCPGGSAATRAARRSAGGARKAPRRPAPGARARVLRRVYAVRACGAPRCPPRNRQEPDVRRPQPTARRPRTIEKGRVR